MAPELKLYAICSAVLTLQMLFLGALTAATRAKHNGYLSPEDGKVSRANATYVGAAEHPDTARVQRVHRNLLESLPMFFALGGIYLATGAPATGATVCFLGFTVARLLHMIVYLKAVQPWRTIFYALGSLSLLAMIVLILLTVLRS